MLVISFTRSFLQAVEETIKDIMVLCNLCSSLGDNRMVIPLLILLGIHVLAMTLSVWLRYKDPTFTALVFAVYGPVLTVTILIVSAVIDERLYFLVQITNSPAL